MNPSKKIKAKVSTHIVIDTREVSSAVLDLIKSALTFKNEEKERAKKELVYGWEGMPDHIFLFTQEGYNLLLPRGFASKLKSGIKQFGLEVEWEDARVKSDHGLELTPVEARLYQEEAVETILKHQQGIYQAPSGAGKTVTMLEAIRRLGQRSLIIVDKTNIAEQWRERAKTFLGYEPGLIGDQVWDVRPITVALQQTLWRRRSHLDAKQWWRLWGLVCSDESHHVSAQTFSEVIQRFPAFYRIGLSATPKKGSKSIPLAEAVLGEIFLTTKEELIEYKVLMKPEVVIVHTGFKYPYHSTFYVGKYDHCRLNCGRHYAHKHQNNYQQMMAKLIRDKDRNLTIAAQILEQRGHCNMVISRRLAHLDTLRALVKAGGWPEDKLLKLTGKESREERMAVAKQAEDSDVVIFSTIADEALDIPRLDRIFLAWPTRSTDLIIQQIGRIERISTNGKVDAKVFDFVDEVGVLKDQYRSRKREVYARI